MVILSLTVPEAELDLVIAELWEHRVEGIREQDPEAERVRLDAFLADPDVAARLAALFPQYQPSLLPADERDWVAHSRELWHPLAVGDRFYLVPDWDTTAELPEGRVLLPMPLGQGFGSGFHESTQLALSALENTPLEGASVLDVGTGSGILLAAAYKLGATQLAGCDVDSVAIEAARSYLAGLQIPATFYDGSIDATRPARFDVVLANLNATLILNLLDDLLSALRPQGRLILSGILADEASTIHQALESMRGVTRIYHSALGDWVNFRVTTGTGAA